MIIKKLKSIIARWAHDDENKRLREKLRMYKGYLRAANKGAECNARVAQLSAARNSDLCDRVVELYGKLSEQKGPSMREIAAKTAPYSGHVPCPKCGKTHWMYAKCADSEPV